MASVIEQITTELTEASFFRDLCFTGQTFGLAGGASKELADVFVWLESVGIVIQVKERDKDTPTVQEQFEKWFKNKVLDKGSDQIADTLSFFKDHPTIKVKNARGIEFQLAELNAAAVHKLIVFGTLIDGIEQHRRPKCHLSKRSGFIHLIQSVDFMNLLRWTVTPGEMLAYLGFREQVLQDWKEANSRTEKWLFGCFIHWTGSGHDPECLGEAEGEGKVDSLADDTGQASNHLLFDHLGKWAATTANPKDFARILVEIALMSRSMAREFKIRAKKCLDNLDKPFPLTVYRLCNPVRQCLFLLTVPVGDSIEQREKISAGMLLAAKYAVREARRAVGFFFARNGIDEIGMTPILAEGEWEEFAPGENALREFPVLARPFQSRPANTYSSKQESA